MREETEDGGTGQTDPIRNAGTVGGVDTFTVRAHILILALQYEPCTLHVEKESERYKANENFLERGMEYFGNFVCPRL